MEKLERLYTTGGTVVQFLKMLNIVLPYDPAIPLLSTYPWEMKTYVHIKICTWMVIAALFIVAKKWKKPKCPSTDEWINTKWFIHTIEYYSIIKTNKVLIHATAWISLENIMVTERSQSPKNHISRIRKSIKRESWSVVF